MRRSELYNLALVGICVRQRSIWIMCVRVSFLETHGIEQKEKKGICLSSLLRHKPRKRQAIYWAGCRAEGFNPMGKSSLIGKDGARV